MRDELSYSVRNKTDDELNYLVISDHEVIVLIINDVVNLNH